MARMGLEQQLTDTLTRAIKDKDAPTANVVRMLKTEAPGAADGQGLLRHGGRRARRRRHRRLSQAAPEGARGVREGGRARRGAGRPAPLRDRVLRALPAAGHGRGGAARAGPRAPRRARHRRRQAGGAAGRRRHEDAQGPGRGRATSSASPRSCSREAPHEGRDAADGDRLRDGDVTHQVRAGRHGGDRLRRRPAGTGQGPDLHRPQSRRRGPARPRARAPRRAGDQGRGLRRRRGRAHRPLDGGSRGVRAHQGVRRADRGGRREHHRHVQGRQPPHLPPGAAARLPQQAGGQGRAGAGTAQAAHRGAYHRGHRQRDHRGGGDPRAGPERQGGRVASPAAPQRSAWWIRSTPSPPRRK